MECEREVEGIGETNDDDVSECRDVDERGDDTVDAEERVEDDDEEDERVEVVVFVLVDTDVHARVIVEVPVRDAGEVSKTNRVGVADKEYVYMDESYYTRATLTLASRRSTKKTKWLRMILWNCYSRSTFSMMWKCEAMCSWPTK